MSSLQVSNRKDRHFFIRTYLDEIQIKVIITSHNIQHYAYILHNKDVKENGEEVEPHYHVLLSLFNKTSARSVNRWFSGFIDNKNQLIQSYVEIAVDRYHCFDYLSHNTKACVESGAYIYDKSLIKCDDYGFYNGSRSADFDSSTNCLLDLIAGVPYQQLVYRYGRDFIMNHQKYIDVACLMYRQECFKPKDWGLYDKDVIGVGPAELSEVQD